MRLQTLAPPFLTFVTLALVGTVVTNDVKEAWLSWGFATRSGRSWRD